jgi:hypothetical protein
MGRIAALFVLASQLVLVWAAVQPTGSTAIWFSFVGHPLLAVGSGLGLWALARRLRDERQVQNLDPRES